MAWKLLQIGVVALWTYLLIEGALMSTGQLRPLEMILVGGIGLGVGMAAVVTGVVYCTLEGCRVLGRSSPSATANATFARHGEAPSVRGDRVMRRRLGYRR
jgi:hypothetical protein